MISRKNWEKSRECYGKLVKALKNNTVYDGGVCGYCLEHGIGCKGCIFIKEEKECAEKYGGYFTMDAHINVGNLADALPIAERIYQAILDDEVNVYEED
jgi:hypothetical protein